MDCAERHHAKGVVAAPAATRPEVGGLRLRVPVAAVGNDALLACDRFALDLARRADRSAGLTDVRVATAALHELAGLARVVAQALGRIAGERGVVRADALGHALRRS